MKSLWQKIFGSVDNSNSVAKSRLHFVLVQDRTGLSTEEMADFKEELVGVIEKYFEIDKDRFDLSYERENEETALVINSPVIVRKLSKKEKEQSKKTAKETNTKANKQAPKTESQPAV